MSSPAVYYSVDGTPFIAASVPLPVSPYHSPFGSPYASPYMSPQVSPRNSPYGRLVPLPPSPVPLQVMLPGPAFPGALPLPPTTTSIAAGTEFTPHPMLQFDAEDPVILWDVRLPPETIRISRGPSRNINRLVDQAAISPPWTFMRLRSSLLPWIVECTSPSGVTLRDVLDGIYECLRQKIEIDDWQDASVEFQNRALEAWKRRCKMVGEMDGRAARVREERRGICRVDWLLWDFEWLGMTRSKSELETWDIHFRSR